MGVFEKYKSIFGNLRVKKAFEIPSTEDWPKQYHGKKLGKYVDAIRQSIKGTGYRGLDKAGINQLITNGFVVDEDVEQERRTLEGFRLFVEKNGHTNVDQYFRIPKDDLSWPEDVRGLALGQKLVDIKKFNFFCAHQTNTC